MLNYLAQRRNPTGFISYMPLEVSLFGEDRIIEGFTGHPPDAVLVVTRDLHVYDVKPFGEGYAQQAARLADGPLSAGGGGVFRGRPVSNCLPEAARRRNRRSAAQIHPAADAIRPRK